MTKKQIFIIRKTCLCSEYPLISHFHIAKQGYRGVNLFLSHLLIARCDIGVQISVRQSVRASIRLSTIMSKLGFLYTYDSCECETLHSYCP